MMAIRFDTHLGRLTYRVPEDEVMDKVGQIMACPGTFNVSVEMENENE